MKLEVLFPQLDQLVRNMGAEPIQWLPTSEILDPLEGLRVALETRGIDVDLEEVEVADDGRLVFNDEQVVLYIRDTRNLIDDLLHNPEETKRIHLAWCKTLESMDKRGRFERYVVTKRTDGLFVVEGYTDDSRTKTEELDAKLMACKYCLGHLNYKGYADSKRPRKNEIWREFDIQEFFDKYDTSFKKKPTYTDKTAPKSGYTKDWDSISRKYREAAGWKCEEPKCGVDLSNEKSLLQTHHLNGVQSDNRTSNLKALCVLCHSQQPNHNWMSVKPMDELKIMRLRQAQKNAN